MEKETKDHKIEKTLVLIKPDGVQRNLIGKIITRFEDTGLKIVGMKLQWIDEDFARKHYTEDIEKRHGKSVREGLITYILEGPVVAIVLEGVNAIENVRKLVGPTYPNDATPGTIRGDFAHISKNFANNNSLNVRNLIHASANEQDAKVELALWFTSKEIHSYDTVHDIIAFSELLKRRNQKKK